MVSSRKVVVATGGGFDPIHIGHLNLLEEAKCLGDHLQVWLCTDEWLIRKKGYYFLPYEHRKAVLEALPFVDEVVVQIDDGTQSCAAAIKVYQPDILVKGGTYHIDNLPKEEKDALDEVGCDIMFGVGGYLKEGSSTDFFKNAVKKLWERKPK